jgi:hypothetical protein
MRLNGIGTAVVMTRRPDLLVRAFPHVNLTPDRVRILKGAVLRAVTVILKDGNY